MKKIAFLVVCLFFLFIANLQASDLPSPVAAVFVLIDDTTEDATTPVVSISPDDDNVYYFNSTFVQMDLSGGRFDRLYIDGNNDVYFWHGDLGRRTKIIDNVRSVYGINAGTRSFHTYFFITKNNELWAMGHNARGLVGDDTGLDRSSPVFIMEDVANLYVESYQDGGSRSHTVYALKTDKTRWGWGRVKGENIFAPTKIDGYFNHNPQLLANHISTRNGNAENYPKIPLSDEIEAFLGGRDNITTSIEIGNGNRIRYYAITKDGSLWGWGHNDGTLGDGTRATRRSPVRIAEKVKRLTSDHFITQSNDWYVYSYTLAEPLFNPHIRLQNALYAYSTWMQRMIWYTPEGKLMEGASIGGKASANEIISSITIPSIVRAADGHVIAPRPEHVASRTSTARAIDLPVIPQPQANHPETDQANQDSAQRSTPARPALRAIGREVLRRSGIRL